MNNIKQQIKKFPKTLLQKIEKTYGSLDKFYATVYLIARNEHLCQISTIAAAEQRLNTIRAYQGMIRFMLDEEGVDGKSIMDQIASDYLEDFVHYKEPDFGMTDEEFISIIKKIG